jgi:hypothetical protein
MQVKVCPKCKAENRPTNAACSSCYASLEAVIPTESSGPARTQSAPAAKPRTPAAPMPTQQMPAAQRTQMGTTGPPPGFQHMTMQPAKRRSSAGIIVLVVFLSLAAIGGLGFAVARSGMLKTEPLPTQPPDQVVLKYLAAKKTRSLAKVEPYLSRQSIELVQKAFGSRQAQSAGFGKSDAESMYVFDAQPSVQDMTDKRVMASVAKDDQDADERTAIVRVVVDEQPGPAPAPKPIALPGVSLPDSGQTPAKKSDLSSLFHARPIHTEFVVVAEDGQWKVDIKESFRRAMGMGRAGNPFKLGK